MTTVALVGIGAIAAFWVLLSISASLPALTVWKGSLVSLDDAAARECLSRALATGMVESDWAEQHGFEPSGAYLISTLPQAVQIVAWTNAHESTYLCMYLYANNMVHFDFVTISEDRALTTGTSKDGQLFPSRPGSWRQTFWLADAAQIWPLHQAALKYLAQVADFRPSAVAPPIIEEFPRAMRLEATYIRSLFLWPLRTPYWYFTRRDRLHEKSVQSQLEGRSAV